MWWLLSYSKIDHSPDHRPNLLKWVLKSHFHKTKVRFKAEYKGWYFNSHLKNGKINQNQLKRSNDHSSNSIILKVEFIENSKGRFWFKSQLVARTISSVPSFERGINLGLCCQRAQKKTCFKDDEFARVSTRGRWCGPSILLGAMVTRL